MATLSRFVLKDCKSHTWDAGHGAGSCSLLATRRPVRYLDLRRGYCVSANVRSMTIQDGPRSPLVLARPLPTNPATRNDSLSFPQSNSNLMKNCTKP
ncbi:hypothetical protein CRG98_042354 [Punica granatum]|uniref:Uncharacterized protein n=1 Tax=Punica granatum TaxID=22663 RepID=A0A2I0I097_PUNGR|nr:hypothetical protein CRG98_042354 [Punica granatum]